jgi:hypothetical protein
VALSRRAVSARRNAKLGGLKTASNHSPEYLKLRASKAGSATRDKYGLDFYRYLRNLANPLKPTKEKVIEEVTHIPSNKVSSAVLMRSVAQNLGDIGLSS